MIVPIFFRLCFLLLGGSAFAYHRVSQVSTHVRISGEGSSTTVNRHLQYYREAYGNAVNAQGPSTVLETEVERIINVEENDPVADLQPMQPNNVLTFLADRIQRNQRTCMSDAISAIRQYIGGKNADHDIDPMEYWKIKAQHIKHIAQRENLVKLGKLWAHIDPALK
ncbi:uncharacterized protein LOC122756914 [Drosophila mojavensis]|uniref:uncharacterized protein LOC122756914 n=1 Tax=Drosophila mojavensis TaxID=7230 RepID=UPI001CD07D21|nr:uncharacterized protein LOC122756914 [Drosophila mojavensis]